MNLQQQVAYRADRLGFWLRRLQALHSEERELKATMDPEVAITLKDKNILLWKEMLVAAKYPDMGVVDEFTQGSELVGTVERTGLWPSRFQPATISLDELDSVAAMERGLLHQQFAGAAPHAEEVWRKTMDEVDAGTLVGPLSLSDVPPDHPLSKRFGIMQGQKVGCIDDFSRSSVNSCVQSCESPKPHTLDVFGALCVMMMSTVAKTGAWKGRTFDLVGAYRQCAVRPSSRKYAHIAVQHPSTLEVFAFRMKALPFGAIRSVHSFLRVSFSLWFLLVTEFMVLATNYFDDYVVLASDDETASLTSCIHMFFNLVGWDFAEVGNKAPDFSCLFQALGVVVDVTSMHKGLATVGNTDSRRSELVHVLNSVLEKGALARHEALRLRGRLQFAAGNLFGRVAKSALSIITMHAYGVRGSKLSDQAIMALRLYVRLLVLGKPRELKPASNLVWYIQTDASFEPGPTGDLAGIGAVLFDPLGKPVKFFSNQLSSAMVQALNPLYKKNAIFECEFFALFCAFLLWGDDISGAVVMYTDNNAVRDVMIACHTNNELAKVILVATLGLECEKQLQPWYARIPTDSNMADGPSRMFVDRLIQLGATACNLDVNQCWDAMLAYAEKWGENQATVAIPTVKKL